MNKSTCSVAECGSKAHCGGMCGKHYARFKRYGDPLVTKSKPRSPAGTRSICEVDGCDRHVKGHGYCLMHYQRFKKTGDPLLNPSGRTLMLYPEDAVCAVDMCGDRPKKRGYCGKHYQRFVTHGDPLHVERVVLDECKASECDRPPFGHGYCSLHYYRFVTTGDPMVTPSLVNPVRRCAQCGEVMDLSEPFPGRVRPSYLLKNCLNCRRDTHLPRYVPELIERDGPGCHICGDVVDLSLSHPDPMSRSVDHIIPRSRGGADHVSNYALSHLLCNLRKGDRVEEGALF